MRVKLSPLLLGFFCITGQFPSTNRVQIHFARAGVDGSIPQQTRDRRRSPFSIYIEVGRIPTQTHSISFFCARPTPPRGAPSSPLCDVHAKLSARRWPNEHLQIALGPVGNRLSLSPPPPLSAKLIFFWPGTSGCMRRINTGLGNDR
jgi:hypothetical protein